ncbi:hypothetical protein RchiOBHm_Chr2g0152771 [Rosa chinensis]|uniref:Uncharacterized protein n=1 Tax=Rosa chinensis TaxID=74649 RepID=A0A2P6S0J4_ROSCH|nr:hypothetical protein RchiOBHm_Chr2g0152771 [Rosa chinensis]
MFNHRLEILLKVRRRASRSRSSRQQNVKVPGLISGQPYHCPEHKMSPCQIELCYKII